MCMPFDCNNDLKDKQNPIVFIAAEIVLANANRIPIDAPNSGPMDLEMMKYRPPERKCYVLGIMLKIYIIGKLYN